MMATQEQALWARRTFLLGIAGTVAIFVTVFFTFRAAWAAERSADAALEQSKRNNEEFAFVHRPRLRIRNVVCSSDNDGPRSGGQFIISNYGDTEAEIIGSHVRIESRSGPLPSRRPYDGLEPNNPVTVGVIGAGQPFTAVYGTADVATEDDFFKYPQSRPRDIVMGFVDYLDRVGTRRRTAFCRIWDRQQYTFIKSEDENYEHEE